MGNGEWGMGDKGDEEQGEQGEQGEKNTMPNAQCPIPNAQRLWTMD
ncbi:hypothetical protein [Nostoc sp. CMAA1605]|nr:hypothetical protein [Nostoc sp. CMAA1605]